MTRLKQGLRAQIEAVPQKLFNVATDAKKNVPKTYNTGEVVPAYHPVQQSNLGGLGAIIENVKIPTVYGTISPKLPNLPKLPKGPDLHTFLYGNQVRKTAFNMIPFILSFAAYIAGSIILHNILGA